MWPLILGFFTRKSAKIGIAVVIVMILGYGFHYINSLQDKLVEETELRLIYELNLETKEREIEFAENNRKADIQRISDLEKSLNLEKSKIKRLNNLLKKQKEDAIKKPEEGVIALNLTLSTILSELRMVTQ